MTMTTEELIDQKIETVAEVYADDKPAPSRGMKVPDVPKKAGKYDDVPREMLFHLNDVDYMIPKEIPPNVVFAYLRDARKGGAEMAFANMFVELCGEEALDVLADYDDMQQKEMKDLIKALQKRVAGALELGN